MTPPVSDEAGARPFSDRLNDEQSAIVELLVRRGRSYGSLAEMLATPEPAVRERAHGALLALSPVSGARVDSELRELVADYLLGQHSAREARATRRRLAASDAARAWALSLSDALAPLYEGRPQPEIPEAAAPAADRASGDAESGRTAEPAEERGRAAAADDAAADSAGPDRGRRGRPTTATLLRRRRLAVAAAVVAVLAIAGGIVALTTGGGGGKKHPAAGGQLRIVGELALVSAKGENAQGAAAIAQRGSQSELIVSGKFAPTQPGYEYVVWLANSARDAVPVGARTTDAQGNFRGAGPLPSTWTRYRFVEIVLVRTGPPARIVRPIAVGTFAGLRRTPAR